MTTNEAPALRHTTSQAVVRALAFAACLVSCGDDGSAGDPPIEHPFVAGATAVSVAEVLHVGDGAVDFACESLCAHAASGTAGAGVFVVDRLVVVEEDDASGGSETFVYMVLAVEESWHGVDASGPVVARSTSGAVTGLDLDVGDRFAGFLRGGSADYNAGFPHLLGTRRYFPSGDRWYTVGSGCAGDTFYDTETLRSATRAAYASFAPGEFSAEQTCFDIDFDRCPTESLIPPGWLPYDNPCGGE